MHVVLITILQARPVHLHNLRAQIVAPAPGLTRIVAIGQREQGATGESVSGAVGVHGAHRKTGHSIDARVVDYETAVFTVRNESQIHYFRKAIYGPRKVFRPCECTNLHRIAEDQIAVLPRNALKVDSMAFHHEGIGEREGNQSPVFPGQLHGVFGGGACAIVQPEIAFNIDDLALLDCLKHDVISRKPHGDAEVRAHGALRIRSRKNNTRTGWSVVLGKRFAQKLNAGCSEVAAIKFSVWVIGNFARIYGTPAATGNCPYGVCRRSARTQFQGQILQVDENVCLGFAVRQGHRALIQSVFAEEVLLGEHQRIHEGVSNSIYIYRSILIYTCHRCTFQVPIDAASRKCRKTRPTGPLRAAIRSEMSDPHPDLLELYNACRDSDPYSVEEFAAFFYGRLGQWLETGQPAPGFVEAFDSLFSGIQDAKLSSRNLLDLGIVQTAEAVNSFRSEDAPERVTRFYLAEARMPFFAAIDLNAFRGIKEHQFQEIDFQIFEIVGGDFPHEAARNFLIRNPWADIWIVLRYLDGLGVDELDQELIEQLLITREAKHERLILLAYMYIGHRAMLDYMINSETVAWPSDLTDPMARELATFLDRVIRDEDLAAGWSEFLPERARDHGTFALLALFEIMQASLTPGWISLIEASVGNLWSIPYNPPHPAPDHIGDAAMTLQPCAEFAGSIIGLMNEEDQARLLSTSLVLSNFFDKLTAYVSEAYYSLLYPLANAPEFVPEFQLWLSRTPPKGLDETLLERLESAAQAADHTVALENGLWILKPLEDGEN